MQNSYNKPKFVSFTLANGYDINAFIKEVYIQNKKMFNYTFINVGFNFDYNNIISTLINTKYTQDQITAITLNYLLTLHEEVLDEEKIKEYQQEYKELQEYRAACKAEAKQALEYADINDIGPKL